MLRKAVDFPEDLLREIEVFARKESRDFSSALMHILRTGLLALQNPELTAREIMDILEAKAEQEEGLVRNLGKAKELFEAAKEEEIRKQIGVGGPSPFWASYLSYDQDINTLLFPFYFPTKRKVKEFRTKEGTYIVSVYAPPQEKVHLVGNIYFSRQDATLPSPLDGKILKYLIFLAQSEKDPYGNPRKEILTSAREIAKAVLGPGTNPGSSYQEKIIKGLYRLKLVQFEFKGSFTLSEEGEGPRKIENLRFGVLQEVYYQRKANGTPVRIRFDDFFYKFVVRSRMTQKIDFNIVRGLRSGIAQRLYELAIALGPGSHTFRVAEFFERLGIVFRGEKTANEVSKRIFKIKEAAKEVKEKSNLGLGLHYRGGLEGFVMVTIRPENFGQKYGHT